MCQLESQFIRTCDKRKRDHIVFRRWHKRGGKKTARKVTRAIRANIWLKIFRKRKKVFNNFEQFESIFGLACILCLICLKLDNSHLMMFILKGKKHENLHKSSEVSKIGTYS